MGEKSKRIGEIGENIVGNFFNLLGWQGALPGQSLSCKKSIKHARDESKTGKRDSHGIDYLYCYKSPLEGSTAESAVISVKHSGNAYENNPKGTFRSHAKDLVETLECYKHSELKKQQLELLGRTTKSRDSGVLFWLSSNEETYDDVVSKIKNARLDTDWNFESFHVIDNQRINFLFDALTYLKDKNGQDRLYFYYPETSLSYVDKSISRFGKICPLEFLTSPVVPLIIKAQSDQEQDVFCLSSMEDFAQDSLRRLIQAAKEYTQDMSCKLLFMFPNYVQSSHGDAVKKAATGFENDIHSRMKVVSYRPDFRSMNDED
ncbi:TPA: hypothetical protein QEK57_002050 [Stenotrophomonas maltophilia]|nr:hypothetical protein [Stenotrophomonas maltophilia]HDS1312966.1 hypothetical protein [Stenotrophomonas maltophilia]HDS1317445.1 hypothetical protein [Stenotrophomonas maltophilia]HDS1443949.1 hypothetical protein [Stenotrophomonas maltophilia]